MVDIDVEPHAAPSSSPLERMLELKGVPGDDLAIFTSEKNLWQPPGGTGVFGGVGIAQCLSAAQKTVAADFVVHSVHCSFFLPANQNPISYHVQSVRDGWSFATRTVMAKQEDKLIIMGTVSFMREAAGGKRPMTHAHSFPAEGLVPPTNFATPDGVESSSYAPRTVIIGVTQTSGPPQDVTFRSWFRAPISEPSHRSTTLSQVLLAYMSDWNFLPGVPIAQSLWRFSDGKSDNDVKSPLDGTLIQKMASLDHTMYFHAPLKIRAEEWMLLEVQSPWSGGGRGLVMGRIFDTRGTLLATCIQEGYVRLRDDSGDKTAKL